MQLHRVARRILRVTQRNTVHAGNAEAAEPFVFISVHLWTVHSASAESFVPFRELSWPAFNQRTLSPQSYLCLSVCICGLFIPLQRNLSCHFVCFRGQLLTTADTAYTEKYHLSAVLSVVAAVCSFGRSPLSASAESSVPFRVLSWQTFNHSER